MKRNEVFPPVTKEEWRELVERDPKASPIEEKLVTALEDGIVARPLYTRTDRESHGEAGLPGAAPWIRGTHPLPREEGWEVRQIVDGPTPAEAARQARIEIGRGSTALLLRIGPEGISLGGAADLGLVLEGLSLESIAIELDAGTEFERAAAWLRGIWEKRGTPQDVRGSLGADPVAATARTGAEIAPMLEALAPLARSVEAFPRVRSVRASAAPFHDAGATAAQEMAAVLSAAVAYLRHLHEGGLSIDAAARQIAIELPVGPDVFWEIAKLRAMRWIWGRALRAAGSVSPPRIEATTSWRMMTVRDPWVNLLRTTSAAFAAAVGGAESLGVLPFDATLGVSDDFARRLARNIQRILLDESQLHHVLDPAGGSFYLESLTEELAREAWAKFQDLEREGGVVEALRSGRLQREIAAARAEREKLVAQRKLPLTGLSEFPDPGEKLPRRPRRTPAPPLATPAIEPLARRRLGASFEALRDRSDAHLASSGERPRIFMANLGSLATFNARATWCKNLLAAGGIEAVGEEGYSSGAAAAEAFSRSGCKLALICGADATYENLAAESARALREAGASHLLLAGRPGEKETEFREAGIDGFIFAGQDVVEILTSLLRISGVSDVEADR